MSAVTTMPNASAISRLISKRGFQKALEGTTRIPGYHIFTEGFKVENGMSSVLVSYQFGTWSSKDFAAASERRDAVMKEIAALLRDKGYEVLTSALQPSLISVKKVVA